MKELDSSDVGSDKEGRISRLRSELRWLQSCTCDFRMEAVLSGKPEGDSTMLVFGNLSDLTKKFPWLEDERITVNMLELLQHREHGIRRNIISGFELRDFDEAMGYFFTQKVVNGPMCSTRHHRAQEELEN